MDKDLLNIKGAKRKCMPPFSKQLNAGTEWYKNSYILISKTHKQMLLGGVMPF